MGILIYPIPILVFSVLGNKPGYGTGDSFTVTHILGIPGDLPQDLSLVDRFILRRIFLYDIENKSIALIMFHLFSPPYKAINFLFHT